MSKTYSTTIEITEEKEYPVTITAGLDLSAWITAGSTTDYPLNPSSYADFATLEADEDVIRQLMLVHNAVDYLATAGADDALIEDIINSDICAKWINLSDYALDTLYANSDIADEMDTADKYGYGEWVKLSDSPETWGAKGNVPIMTADNAPYGNAIGTAGYSSYARWKAFDGDDTTSGSDWELNAFSAGCYLGYDFVIPICPRMVKVGVRKGSPSYIKETVWEVKGSNDGGSTWESIDSFTTQANTDADQYGIIGCNAYYKQVAVFPQSANWGTTMLIQTLQFYGREEKLGNGVPTPDYSEKEFATGSTRKTIYDHGVKPSGAITGGTDDGNNLTLSAVGTATVTIDKGTRTYMGGKVGLHASGTNRLKCGSGYSAFTASNMPDSNGFDISSISGSVAVGIEQTASGTFDAVEIWIE